jgi:lipopolysaccharide/colanic/teichoic acid biosynthesis glycosyltransferase/GGDEF domain-containing protein
MHLSDLWGRFKSFVQFGQSMQLPGMCSAKHFETILEIERRRADRNRREFSLVVFDVGNSDENHIQIRYLAHVLRDRIRSTDRMGWLDNRRVGIVLPYTSEAGAWRLADDVCQAMAGKAAPPECIVYTYPSERDWENGEHSEQLHFADLSPEWKTTTPGAFSMSAKRVSSLNNDFASEQSPADTVRNGHEVTHSPELLFAQRLPRWKRGMDIVGALLALILLSPLLLLLGLIIKIVSPGPIIFKQERLRRLGRMFRMWKFRTMSVDTDISIHKQHVVALINGDKNGGPGLRNPMVKLDDRHPQIIPLGKLFRKTCLDELPQLINVLRGEMSLVGPRPPLPYEVDEYPQWCYGRFNAVPGMTGLWQVNGKNRLTFDEMVRLDIRYSKEKSLWLDTKIIMKTPLAIISQIKDSLRTNNGRKEEL